MTQQILPRAEYKQNEKNEKMKITASKRTTYSGHKGPIYTIQRGIKHDEIVSGSSDLMIGTWSLTTGRESDFSAQMPTHIIAITTIPEHGLIVAGTSGGTLHFLNPEKAIEVKSEKYFDAQVFDLSYSPKHKLLFASSGDGRLIVSDGISLMKLKTLQLCNEKVRSIAIHPNEDSVAIASSDGRIRVFSLPLMKETHNFHAHNLAANTVAWNPNGKVLLSGGRDAHLNAWDAEHDFQQTNSIPAHNYAIYSITFSPDGQFFATGSRDKTVKIWKSENQELLLRINNEKQQGHVNSVNKVLWAEHGLISAGDDRAIFVWEISSD